MAQTLADVIAEHAQSRPDAVAIAGPGDATRTWSELHRRASQVANALVAKGIGRGDRVGMLDKNDPTFFEVAIGCNQIGAVVVGMNWRLSPRELEQIAGNADLSLLVASTEFLDQVPTALRSDDRLVVTGTAYETWISGAGTTPPVADVGPDDVVYQLYSSGTTGLPKGALITSANLLWTVRPRR